MSEQARPALSPKKLLTVDVVVELSGAAFDELEGKIPPVYRWQQLDRTEPHLLLWFPTAKVVIVRQEQP